MTCSLSLAMWRYSGDPRTRNYVKECGFLSLFRKYKKKLLGTRLLDHLKTSSKKAVHKTAEVLRNKIANVVYKSNDKKLWNKNLLKKELFLQKKEKKY